MTKTIKLLWGILIIILLNLLIISLVNHISTSTTNKNQNFTQKQTDKHVQNSLSAPSFIKTTLDNLLKGKAPKEKAIKTQTATDKTGQYGNADFTLLAKVISAEARAEPYVGQVAVGAVILNRVEHPSFPNTIAGVVYQPDAFTCMYDGNIDQEVVASAYRAAQDAINGWDPSGGALYYYNPAKTSNQWMKSRPQVTTIGEHIFCN